MLHFPSEEEEPKLPEVANKQEFIERVYNYNPLYQNKISGLFKKPY